jgi:hypothetical protein
MDRVIYSLSTFVAVFCTVVVGIILLSLSGLYRFGDADALVAYAAAAILGVASARWMYRWTGTRAPLRSRI